MWKSFHGLLVHPGKKTFIICFPGGLALFLSLSRYSDFSCCASIYLYMYAYVLHSFYLFSYRPISPKMERTVVCGDLQNGYSTIKSGGWKLFYKEC